MVFLGQRIYTFYLVIYIAKLPSTNTVPIDIPINREEKSPFLSPTPGIGAFFYANIIGDQYILVVFIYISATISEIVTQSLGLSSLEPD